MATGGGNLEEVGCLARTGGLSAIDCFSSCFEVLLTPPGRMMRESLSQHGVCSFNRLIEVDLVMIDDARVRVRLAGASVELTNHGPRLSKLRKNSNIHFFLFFLLN